MCLFIFIQMAYIRLLVKRDSNPNEICFLLEYDKWPGALNWPSYLEMIDAPSQANFSCIEI